MYAVVIDDGFEYQIEELYTTREAADRACMEKNAESCWHHEVEDWEVKE